MPEDIWENVSDELRAAYNKRASLADTEAELHAAKKANSEEIARLEAEHLEAHRAGGEPQQLGA